MSSAALMSSPHTVRVGDAVTLHILQTERFKTARLSISAILPADQVLSPRMTLLFGVLRRGSRRFPSQLHINRRLDELYGATLTIRNFHAGDRQVLGFTAEMLDDSCLPAADRGLDILGGVADLLAGLILEPLTDEDGVLRRRSVEQEKQALCDAILADRNQARSYAEGRMRHILYGQEPSGVSLFGRPEHIRDVTAEQLTTLWQSFLACARLEVFYVGKASPETLETHWRAAFAALKPACRTLPPTLPHAAPLVPRRVDEARSLSQGRLCMGWSSGITQSENRQLLPAAILFNEMLGVMQDSLLFRHVREELGLCYYCDSAFFGSKGVLTVSCGVAPANRTAAENAIRTQAEGVAAGSFTVHDLRLAKASYGNAFRQIPDSPCALENLWFGRVLNGTESAGAGFADASDTPESRLAQVLAVDRRQLMRAAARFVPDTVYFLGSEPGAAHGAEDDGLSDCDCPDEDEED